MGRSGQCRGGRADTNERFTFSSCDSGILRGAALTAVPRCCRGGGGNLMMSHSTVNLRVSEVCLLGFKVNFFPFSLWPFDVVLRF